MPGRSVAGFIPAIAVACGLLLAPAAPAAPVRSLLEARQQNVVIQEWDSSCGAAALATILRYQLGDPVTERSVALGMLHHVDPDRVRGRGGFSLLDMKRFAESRGFAADGYAQLTPGQLLRLAPAIVPMRSNGGDHFVVFRGVVRGQAILADPAFGNRSMPFPVFQSQWKEGIGFAVQPRSSKRSGNRMMATRRDLLRVDDESVRRELESESLPRPLLDAQLGQLFAIGGPSIAGPLPASTGPGVAPEVPLPVSNVVPEPTPGNVTTSATSATPAVASSVTASSGATTTSIATSTAPSTTVAASTPVLSTSISTTTASTSLQASVPLPSIAALPSVGLTASVPRIGLGH